MIYPSMCKHTSKSSSLGRIYLKLTQGRGTFNGESSHRTPVKSSILHLLVANTHCFRGKKEIMVQIYSCLWQTMAEPLPHSSWNNSSEVRLRQQHPLRVLCEMPFTALAVDIAGWRESFLWYWEDRV